MEALKDCNSACFFEKVTLLWSDRYDSYPKREPVDVIRRDGNISVLRSVVSISERTQVYLSGNLFMGNGIVRSCRSEGSCFILTISMSTEAPSFLPRPEFDPGVLSVDSFLTEEEEANILGSLEADIPRTAVCRNWSSAKLLSLQVFSSSLQAKMKLLGHLHEKALYLLLPVSCY